MIFDALLPRRLLCRALVPAAALALGFGMGGCQKATDRADLVFLNGAEPETLDPSLITGQPEGRLAAGLFEGLTNHDSHGQVVPGVAESWEISPDGRTYLFHLRKNARWSNGDPVTAPDFVGSWQRTLAPATAAEYAYQLYYLRNGKAYNEGRLADFTQVGVHAPDDETLRVELESPTPFFLDLCASTPLMPVPLKCIAQWGDDWIKPGRMVSNGPFQLDAWRINDRVRLVRNADYWDAAHVAMRSIDALPISRANTAFNFYAAGQADLIMDKGLTPLALLNELRVRPDFHSAPFLGNYFLRFNVTRKPFDDARVRKALSLVIDKQSIVEKITRAGEKPAASLVPPGTAGYEPPPGLARDPEEARRLLAEAGYPGGKNFPLVTFLYTTSEMDESIAVELQSMFHRELGIDVGLQRQEWKVYLNSMSSVDYDFCRSSWVGDYNDPNTFLDMFVTDGGNNRTGFASASYDKLIAEAAREVNQARRFDDFRAAEHQLIAEQSVICPLFYYVGIQFYDGNRLGGMAANLLDEHPLKEMYWKVRK